MKEKPPSPGQKSARAFLFRKSGSAEGKMKPSPRLPAIGIRELSASFPRMGVGKEFIDEALGRMEDCLRFGVMLIRLESFGEKESGKETALCLLKDTARSIEAVCTPAGGIWGLIEQALFGAFFPRGNESLCREYAEKIQAQLFCAGKKKLRIGISAYPLARFARIDTIRNARKALEHGDHSGSCPIRVFDAVSLHISGDRYYRQGKIKKAIEEFKTALVLNPSDADIHNSLGVCYGILGAQKSALEEFKTAAQIAPEDEMPLYNAGLICLQMGETGQALDSFFQSLEIKGDFFASLFRIAKIFLDRGQAEKSRVYFRKALEVNPESGTTFRYLGQCCLILGQEDEALAAFENAVRLKADDAAALSELARLYERRGENPDIALSFCRHSAETAPENALYRRRLGRMYQKRGLLQEALAEFEKAQTLGHDCTVYIQKIKEKERTQ